jgi:hypothetical protein
MRTATLIFAAAAALMLAPGAPVSAGAAAGKSFAVNRMVTPNGDGYNDRFFFKCYNPRDAAVDARIYDLSGREQAVMKLVSSGTADFYYTFEWDPNSGGRWPGGVYVYQIRLEKKVYKGTVVIIR